jgi:uncharacterized cupredoxin-like copper-binding protein
VATGALLVGTGAAWTASDQAAAKKRKATLDEWSVTLNKKKVKRGKVTFTVANSGSIKHNFVIVRTNKPAGKLPLKKSGLQAKEKVRVGKLKPFKAGKTRKLTLKLAKGNYVLLCNLPGHYEAGMFVAFKVK